MTTPTIAVPVELLERIACEVTPKTHQEMFDSAKDFAAAIKELRALLAEQPQASAAQSAPAGERETIRAVFLRNGFTVKEGQTDLKPYVYAAAEELLSIARAAWQRTQSAALFGGDERQHIICVCPDCLAEAQRKQSAGVPEGWRLVPADPTPEMIAALGFSGDVDMAIGHAAISMDVANLYRAALAAAPAQPAAQETKP